MLGRACWVWAVLAWAVAAAGLLKAVATEYSECTLNSTYTFYRVCVCRDSNILSYNFALPCSTVDFYSLFFSFQYCLMVNRMTNLDGQL